jgi:uncharacterized protein YggT (Ycf19 family)
MGIVDFILNLAGLLLWLSWRSARFDPLAKRTPATLVGTLRRAEPARMRRWHLLAFIGGLLVLRALFYWQIGSALSPIWTGKLDLGITVLWFRSDLFWRILLFSFLSFGVALGIFYLWLLLFSILTGPEPVHRLVKIPLGRVDGWSRPVKIFLPLVATTLLWWLASWLFAELTIIPRPFSEAHRFESSLLIGLGSYLVWRFPIGAVLALHLLNNYIYFGKHPVWSYVNATAQTLLSPLKKIPLRLGNVDFAPVLGVALVFLLAEAAGRGLVFLYGKLSP